MRILRGIWRRAAVPRRICTVRFDLMVVGLTWHCNELAPPAAIEFQLQFAVPAEELRCGNSCAELRELCGHVQSVLSLASEVFTVLEPRGWRMLTIRFDDEVCITLSKRTSADVVFRDLAELPDLALKQAGRSLHVCATVGEHVYELVLTGDGLRPLSLADSTPLSRVPD